MEYFFYISVMVLLSLVFIEDLRFRAVKWWYFMLLIVGVVGIEYQAFSIWESFTNVMIIVFQLLMLTLYFSIKERRLVNITQKYLGIGDILFWLVACFLFSTVNFLFFFIGSLLFSVVMVLLWKVINHSRKMSSIPLAGLQALFVMVLMVVQFFSSYEVLRGVNFIEVI